MARRRRFSEEPFGPTMERLMDESGVTYRGWKKSRQSASQSLRRDSLLRGWKRIA